MPASEPSSRGRSMAATDRRARLLVLLVLGAGCASVLESARPGELEVTVGTLDPRHPGARSEARHHYRAFRFPEAGWITSFCPAVVDGAGRRLPGPVLWQAVVGDSDRPDLLADASVETVRVLFAAGPELTAITLPDGYGVPIDAESTYFSEALFAESTSPEPVSFRATLGFVPASSGRRLRALVPVWLDVNGPAGASQPSTSGQAVTTRELRFPWAGRLLLAAGQILEHGVRLCLRRQGSDQELVRIEPVRGASSGVIQEIPIARPDHLVRIDPGCAYVVESIYDPIASPELDSRGVILAFVIPDRIEEAEASGVPQVPGQ